MPNKCNDEDIANLKARCEKMESALNVIWTWAHIAKEDPYLPFPGALYRQQFEHIEKKAEEALK